MRGTHGRHGIEEVGDEGGSVLNGLLSLGQVGHRVTLGSEAKVKRARSCVHNGTRVNACVPKDTVTPRWESSLTTDWLCSSSGASVTKATWSRLP